MLKTALFAIAVLGVNGAPFKELKVRQNNEIGNTTSSESEGHWSIFSPQTAKPADTLDAPEGLTTYSPVPSPVTAVTQLSLDTPDYQATESTTQDTTSQTRQPKPIIQPTDISLVVPVTTVSDKASFTTVVSTAHVENSATYIFVPGSDTTTSRKGTPKMPHTENAGSELDQPSKPTDGPDTHDGDDSSNHETVGPDPTATHPMQAGAIVTGEASRAGSDNSAGSQTQGVRTSQQGSEATGSSGNNGDSDSSPTFVVDNTPLVAGGSPITVGGTTYSLASTGSAAVVNGNTVLLTTDSQGHAVLAQTTADAGSSASPTFVVDNTPVIAGGSPITVDGTTYSMASTGSAVVVNGNTMSFATDSQGRAVPVQNTADVSAGESTASATDQALSGLSIASARATTSGETAQETGNTGEQQSNGGASGTQRATSITSTTGGDAGATSTSGGSEPTNQSDNAGASNSPTWPITVVVGAMGLLAMAV